MLAVEFYTGFNILRYFSIKYNLFDFVQKSICLNVDRCEMCGYWAVCKYMYNTSDKNINFIYISRFSFVFQCHHPKICNISQLNEYFFSKKKNCLTLENFDFSTCGEKTLLPRFRVAIQAEPLISSLKDQRGIPRDSPCAHSSMTRVTGVTSIHTFVKKEEFKNCFNFPKVYC